MGISGKHLRIHPPKQEGVRSKAFPAAMGLGYTEVQAEEVEASPGARDGNGLEASTG